MVQFSLKRLFASVTLFAIGSAIVAVAITLSRWPLIDFFSLTLVWGLAGASLGSAVLVPFKEGRNGAIIGGFLGAAWALWPVLKIRDQMNLRADERIIGQK